MVLNEELNSLEDKISALEAYQSQFIENKNNNVIFKYIRDKASYLGNQIGVEYAEGLICPSYFRINDITMI